MQLYYTGTFEDLSSDQPLAISCMFIRILCDTKSKVLQKSQKFHLLLFHLLTQILTTLKMSTNAFSVILTSSLFFSFLLLNST